MKIENEYKDTIKAGVYIGSFIATVWLCALPVMYIAKLLGV